MNKKISDLTAATTPLAGTELFEMVQGGTSKKVAAGSDLGGSAITVEGRRNEPDHSPNVHGFRQCGRHGDQHRRRRDRDYSGAVVREKLSAARTYYVHGRFR